MILLPLLVSPPHAGPSLQWLDRVLGVAIIWAVAAILYETQQYQERAREGEARLKRMMESNMLAIAFWDRDGVIVDANEAFLQLIGLTHTRLAERPLHWSDITPPEYWPLEHRALTELDQRGIFQPFPKEYVRADGRRVPVFVGGARWGGTQEGGFVFAIDLTERKQKEGALRRSRRELQCFLAHLITSFENERGQVALEIHNELAQGLAALKMDLAWVQRRLSVRQHCLIHKIKDMSSLIEGMLRSVRRIYTSLRPMILDDLGLEAAIEWQAQEFQSRTGISCELAIESAAVPLEPERAIALFRIIQECLADIGRQGTATKASISLKTSNGHLILRIQDNGIQRAQEPPWLLTGMQQRAELCSGKVKMSGRVGKGRHIIVRVPIFTRDRMAVDAL